MPEKKLFSISLYDAGDGYKKEDEWKRYSSAYVIAGDLEAATKVAENAVEGDIIVAGINERVGEKVYYE